MRLFGIIFFLLLGWETQACVVNPASQTDLPQSVSDYFPNKFGVIQAWYENTTDRYKHGVFGKNIEATTLHVVTSKTAVTCGLSLTLPKSEVFEDIAPRLADLDGDGKFEIITVRSHKNKGAQIAVFSVEEPDGAPVNSYRIQLIATTPYIGAPYRWLAPIGIADFNGDGYMDIAYIDRPHLLKTLRVWTYRDNRLTEIARVKGFSNHRFGDAYISGGVRNCFGKIEMITADAAWKNVISIKFKGNKIISKTLEPYHGSESFARAMKC